MKIEKGRRVRLRVMLKVVDGAELEKSVVEYIHGSGTMLPGLESALLGLEKGAKKSGVIKAASAFGDPSRRVVKPMTRKEFPADIELAVGAEFMAKGADNNQDVVLRIAKIDGDSVEVHLLHPLADKDLEYNVEVLSVDEPSAPPPIPVDALEPSDSE